MRRAIALAGLAWLLAATPAPAKVEDPLELLGPGVAKALEDQLANLHAEDVDVLVTTTAPAGATVEAMQAFSLRKPKPEALVLVAARQGEAGVALGERFLSRGVTAERAAAIAAEKMPPAFAREVPSDGVVELVRELKLAYTLGERPGYVPPPPPPRTPWEAIVGGAVGAVALAIGALVQRKRRRERLALEERVRVERGRLAKVREDHRALADALEAAARPGDAARMLAEAAERRLAELDASQATLREALRGLSERLERKATAGVADELAGLQRRVAKLHMGVAAMATALAPLLDGPAEADAALAQAERLAGAHAERAGDGAAGAEAGLAEARARLAEARTRLAAGDPVGARSSVARACQRMAPADPDEGWLALMAEPEAGPDLATTLVARWDGLDEALRAEAARDREAGRGREALRGRLEELAGMLTRPRPDLVRIEALLTATERLERARRADQAGRDAPAGVA